MAYRNLIIASPVKLSCRQGQLVIAGEREHTVPLEDINALLLENRQSTVTVTALAELAQYATVYVCDTKHLPSAVMFPFAQHSRQLGVMKLQAKLTLPAKKRLWQQIIKRKVENQGLCLQYVGEKKAADHLFALAETITSGDSEHVEGVAAAYYFRQLFGAGFTREDIFDARNGALNYGYAIMRGHIARLLAVYGFFPSWGIFHRSELNPFNLADDILEPFRPLVDLFVAEHIGEEDFLTPALKRQLFNLLNLELASGGQKHSASYAAERLVQSLHRVFQDYVQEKLLLPKLLKLQQHCYE